MTCEDCIHFEVCKNIVKRSYGGIDICKDIENNCEHFRKSGETAGFPFIAMVEQDIVDGKFAKGRKYQSNNGRYAVVYVDKDKWGCPLIDICGDKHYNKEEAEARLAQLRLRGREEGK